MFVSHISAFPFISIAMPMPYPGHRLEHGDADRRVIDADQRL